MRRAFFFSMTGAIVVSAYACSFPSVDFLEGLAEGGAETSVPPMPGTDSSSGGMTDSSSGSVSDSSSGGPADSAVDGETDAAADSAPDAAPDSSADASADADADADAGGTTDAGDAAADAADAAMDASADADAAAPVDASPVDAGTKVDASTCGPSVCDCDGDGYNDMSKSTVCGAPNDCDDKDPRAHPNQGYLDASPVSPTNGDWNCSNTVEPQFPGNVTCSGLTLGLNCGTIFGFTSTIGCGQPGRYIECVQDTSGLGTSCKIGVDIQRIQGCR